MNHQQFGYDLKDPSPWTALLVDETIPLRKSVKDDYITNSRTKSRQFLLPLIRPVCRIAMITIQGLRIIFPNSLKSSRLLHYSIYWGMKRFLTPEANRLIMRHFHVGSEILQFIRDNVDGIDFELLTLRPKNLEEIKDDLFLNHDLNLFNFIIQLNLGLKKENRKLDYKSDLDFSAVSENEFPLQEMPNTFLNFIDLESAIEIYTPIYQLLLSDSEFWRASHSLQFDETMAIYISLLTGDPRPIILVNNRHPLVPHPITGTAYRLMLHGLSAESLHAFLVEHKKAQKEK